MRIRKVLADGRELSYGGRARYVVFRMSRYPYSVHGDPLAGDAVKWASNHHSVNGFDYLVLDTTDGEVIATYPRGLHDRVVA